MTPRELLAALRVDPALAREFAQVLAPFVFGVAAKATAGPEGYSSRKGQGAPGYSDEAWAALAKKIGVRRGRWFYVSAERLAEYEAGELSTNDSSPSQLITASSSWHPGDDVERLRLRAVNGGARK
jgi:hypothetical protein